MEKKKGEMKKRGIIEEKKNKEEGKKVKKQGEGEEEK